MLRKVPRGQGREALWSQGGKPPEILLRKSFPPQRAKFPYTAANSRSDSRICLQILFLFEQTLRSRFAAEPCEAFASFFAPTRSKKKRTNALCNFYLMRLLSTTWLRRVRLRRKFYPPWRETFAKAEIDTTAKAVVRTPGAWMEGEDLPGFMRSIRGNLFPKVPVSEKKRKPFHGRAQRSRITSPASISPAMPGI